MKEKDLKLIQGDSFYLTLNKLDKEGNEIGFVEGEEIVFSAKKNLKQPEYDIHSDKMTLTEEGKIILYLSPVDTNIKLGTYYYDIQYKTLNKDIYTLVKGELEVVWEVTDE